MTDNYDQYFDISHIKENIDQRTASSGMINIVGNAGMFIIALLSGMVLARLITPTAFGIFAIGETLIAVTETFRTLGLTQAVMQKDEVSHIQLSSIFWINIRFNILVLGVILACAPLVSLIYNQPALWPIISILAFSVFLRAFPSQHESILSRQMSFRSIAMAQVLSVLAGSIVAIAMAFAGAQYWALVTKEIVRFGIYGAILWLSCGWRPLPYNSKNLQKTTDADSINSFLTFGKNYTFTKIILYLGVNFDAIALGYFVGPRGLGFYSKAYRWSLFPIKQIHLALLNVTVSSMSRVRDDALAMLQLVRKTFLPVFGISMGLIGFFFLEADRIILILLGNQWLESILLFRILCIAALATSIERVTKWFYLSLGETRQQLIWSLIYTPTMIAIILIGVQWGTLGTALAFAGGTMLLAVPSILFCLHVTPLTFKDFLDIVLYPAATTLITLGVYIIAASSFHSFGIILVDLVLRACIYGVMYIIIWAILPGGRQSAMMAVEFLKALSR